MCGGIVKSEILTFCVISSFVILKPGYLLHYSLQLVLQLCLLNCFLIYLTWSLQKSGLVSSWILWFLCNNTWAVGMYKLYRIVVTWKLKAMLKDSVKAAGASQTFWQPVSDSKLDWLDICQFYYSYSYSCPFSCGTWSSNNLIKAWYSLCEKIPNS